MCTFSTFRTGFYARHAYTVNFGHSDIGYNGISLITMLISCPELFCIYCHTQALQFDRFSIAIEENHTAHQSTCAEVRYVLTDLMHYSTRHCTPSSSTSFFMVFHAVCCSRTSFTVKSTSTLLLVSHFYMLHLLAMQICT